MNYSLREALKYQQRERLTVAQIHPSLRFTRLGAVLREYATAPDEVGALAHSALTSDHSQPLELMPLHLLKDRTQEEPDHPLAKEFNWERVPQGVQLDQAVAEHYFHKGEVGPSYTASSSGFSVIGQPAQVQLGGGVRGVADREMRLIQEGLAKAGITASPADILSSVRRVYRKSSDSVHNLSSHIAESRHRDLLFSPENLQNYPEHRYD